jgi:hypothetical protein
MEQTCNHRALSAMNDSASVPTLSPWRRGERPSMGRGNLAPQDSGKHGEATKWSLQSATVAFLGIVCIL